MQIDVSFSSGLSQTYKFIQIELSLLPRAQRYLLRDSNSEPFTVQYTVCESLLTLVGLHLEICLRGGGGGQKFEIY